MGAIPLSGLSRDRPASADVAFGWRALRIFRRVEGFGQDEGVEAGGELGGGGIQGVVRGGSTGVPRS
jgi:hypothetical protein